MILDDTHEASFRDALLLYALLVSLVASREFVFLLFSQSLSLGKRFSCTKLASEN